MQRYPKHSRQWYAERAAQAVYDLRDTIPSNDPKLWVRIDDIAGWLSRLGAAIAEGRARSVSSQAPKWSDGDIRKAMRGASSQLAVARKLGGNAPAIRKRCLRVPDLKKAWLALGKRARTQRRAN